MPPPQGGLVSVRLRAAHGTFLLAPAARSGGVSWSLGGGTGGEAGGRVLAGRGSLRAVNAALGGGGLSYAPDPDWSGEDAIEAWCSDARGADPAAAAFEHQEGAAAAASLPVLVAAVNDPPAVAFPGLGAAAAGPGEAEAPGASEDEPLALGPVLLSDPDAPPGALVAVTLEVALHGRGSRLGLAGAGPEALAKVSPNNLGPHPSACAFLWRLFFFLSDRAATDPAETVAARQACFFPSLLTLVLQ